MGFFPQTFLNELITMMSAQYRELLAKLGPRSDEVSHNKGQ